MANFSLTFFGSRNDSLFDHQKSLHDNFLAMCSLPFPKTRSKETQQLIDIFQHYFEGEKFGIIPQDTLTRKRHVGKLMLAILAIDHWQLAREKYSSRILKVEGFKSELKEKINRILGDEQRMRVSQRTHWNQPDFLIECQEQYTVPKDSKGNLIKEEDLTKIQKNQKDLFELLSSNAKSDTKDFCLIKEKENINSNKTIFDRIKELIANFINCKPKASPANDEKRSLLQPNGMHAAFLMPLLNFIFDANCLDFVVNGTKICLGFCG